MFTVVSSDAGSQRQSGPSLPIPLHGQIPLESVDVHHDLSAEFHLVRFDPPLDLLHLPRQGIIDGHQALVLGEPVDMGLIPFAGLPFQFFVVQLVAARWAK